MPNKSKNSVLNLEDTHRGHAVSCPRVRDNLPSGFRVKIQKIATS